ncbi:hypothetical protein DL768_006071 [Monosporascus sp. mg162]|nr:hypothetical protein DL768_006071 [Monosporascus sp. mg162]
MARTFEQFVRFTTDSVGLERTLRFFQAVAQILSSYTLPFNLLIHLLTLSTEKPPSPASTHVILLALRHRFALARRFLRLFRFLESFSAAQKLYVNAASTAADSPRGSKAPRRLEDRGIDTVVWLDIFGRTFNGMYLLLEASTIVDALEIDGLAVWAPQTGRRVSVEAQRFWLFALVCGLLAGLARVVKVLAYAPVPSAGEDYSRGMVDESRETSGAVPANEDREGKAETEKDLKNQEPASLRQVVEERWKAWEMGRRERRAKVRGLACSVMANALDIALPGTAVGWLDLETGTVGVAMFITSILTGWDVWERCGRELNPTKVSTTHRDIPEYGGIEEKKRGTDALPLANATQPPDEQTAAEPEYPSGPKLWVVVFILWLAIFVVTLYMTVVATAAPVITNEFRFLADIGWCNSVYFMTICISQLLFGRLAFRYPISWNYSSAMLLFLVGSAMCDSAPSSSALIAGRAIAGLGCSGLLAGTFSLVPLLAAPLTRPIFIGLIGSSLGLGTALGLLIGGVLTENLTW